MNKLLEEMCPRDVLKIIQNSSIAFVPVSPLFEWHSYHLPLGTDGIIAQEIAKELADTFDGIYFRTLPLALDEKRDSKFKSQIGIPHKKDAFGMNFPNLPLQGEYNEAEDVRRMLNSRLKALKNSKFKFVFIINHHGGTGQLDCLKQIAKNWNSDKFKVHAILCSNFNTFHPKEKSNSEFRHLKTGGHAGIAETLQLMAFRPDLIKLTELPNEELSAFEMGILHNKPVIEKEFNPRNAKLIFAKKWKKSVMKNLTEYIENNLGW